MNFMCPDSIAWLIPSAVGFAGAIIGALVGAFAGYRYMLIHEFNTACGDFYAAFAEAKNRLGRRTSDRKPEN